MTDVTPPPAAAEPPAAPAATTPAVPAATATEVAVVPVKKKSGALGGFALILSIIAILADLVVIIFGVVTLVSAVNGFDLQTFEFGGILAALGAFAAIAVFAFFGGLILGALALLLGLIAAIKGRGRVAGVFAIIFSILVLVTHGSIALAIAQTGDSISNLTSVLPS
jgi:hypothetical protein